MTRRLLSIFLVLFLTALVVGCGGNTGAGNPPPAPGSSTVSITVTDTPPAGVTVLSFEVTITGATLNPVGGGTPVNMLPGGNPIEIEVKQLEAETAFFSTASVPADTYNGLTLNVSKVEFTILNTGAPITAFNQTCGTNQVCEFENLPVAGSATIPLAPPLTIVASTPAGLLIDVNLNAIIQDPLGVNLSFPGGFTVTQVPLSGGTGQLEEIEDVCGRVSAVTPPDQFTLETSGGPLTVKTNSNTQFEDFPPPNNFSSLAVNQIVETDLELAVVGGATMLVAKEVELENSSGSQPEIEGIVSQVISSNQFELVAVEICPPITGLGVGDKLTVTLQSGAVGIFRVDEDGLSVPLNFKSAFEGVSDTSQLLPGQQVQVRRVSGSGTSITTDRVRLRRSRFMGTVSQLILPNNFKVNQLPSIFGSPTAEIEVQTDSKTDFDNVSGVSGLATSNIVSVRGLLFKRTSPAIPLLIAKKVRKR